LTEAGTNVALGFVLALITQGIVYPLFGISTTFATDSAIAVIFTLVSLLRSYLVRRAFEGAGHRMHSAARSTVGQEPSHARS
jgi:hypothetical protein